MADGPMGHVKTRHQGVVDLHKGLHAGTVCAVAPKGHALHWVCNQPAMCRVSTEQEAGRRMAASRH